MRSLIARCLALAAIAAAAMGANAVGTKDGAAAASQPAAAPRQGLHVVFDASLSMCGYLQADDPAKTFSTLVSLATVSRDAQRNNQVMLLKREAQAAKSAADLSPAPYDLQVNSENRAGCGPFSGVGADLRQIFSAYTARPPRSLVLVSDLQMSEKAQIAFVDAFRDWARETGPEHPLSVGMVTLNVPYHGPYFGVDTDNSKAKGIALPQFLRPLSVLWFTVDDADLASVRRLLEGVGVGQKQMPANELYGLQLLPIQTDETARWWQDAKPVQRARQLFGDKPRVTFLAAAKDRQDRWNHCADAAWDDQGRLRLIAHKQCHDGDPFIELLSLVEIDLPLDASKGVAVKPAGANAELRGGMLHVKVPRGDLARQAPIKVPLELSVMPASFGSEKLHDLTLPDDRCDSRTLSANGPNAAATFKDRCIAKVQGRIYRFQEFVDLLTARSKEVVNERVKAVTPELTIQLDYH